MTSTGGAQTSSAASSTSASPPPTPTPSSSGTFQRQPASGATLSGAEPLNSRQAPTAAVAAIVPVSVPGRIMSSLASLVPSPFTGPPSPLAPAQATGLWALLSAGHRGATAAVPRPAGVSDVQVSATTTPVRFTGQPTVVTQVLVAGLRLVKAIGKLVGLNLGGAGLAILPSTSPPPLVTQGLNVHQTEFGGWQVWILQPASPSGKYIVGLHGGGFNLQPTILHWYDYASIVRNTGATVIVPIYPLVQEGGTAATVVPQTADLISSLIDQHGADAVSVYGDSAGANIALAATQELVRRGDPTPARMVLISPVVDLSMSNPAISLIDDPVLGGGDGANASGLLWSGGDLTNPLASPLYGSVAGLPPTWVYTGSLELLAPDVLRLQDKAIAEGADVTFILRKGEIHDWAGPGSIIPFTEGASVRPQIYRQLVGDEA